MPAGVRKMPTAMTSPNTKAVAVRRPICRLNSRSVFNGSRARDQVQCIETSRSDSSNGLKIWIECQIGGPEQACVVTTFSRHDLNFRCRHREGPFSDLAVHVFCKQFPCVHYAAANNDHFGIENID